MIECKYIDIIEAILEESTILICKTKDNVEIYSDSSQEDKNIFINENKELRLVCRFEKSLVEVINHKENKNYLKIFDFCGLFLGNHEILSVDYEEIFFYKEKYIVAIKGKIEKK